MKQDYRPKAGDREKPDYTIEEGKVKNRRVKIVKL
jgi:hypothetical protein